MEIKQDHWGSTPSGEGAELITLINDRGNSIVLTNYGATWVAALLPDKKGKRSNVLAGFNSLQAYLEDTCYIGATVGRYANRIENAAFVIDGKHYKVTANTDDALHCLHGGLNGLNARIWDLTIKDETVCFSITSPDGDQGFPGEVNITVTYHWSNDNKLTITYQATSNRATPLSLTNHAYFNLSGEGKILDHELKIHADKYLPMKEGCIVTGEQRAVEGTVFDFREFKPIGRDLDKADEQLILCKGYDESFVIKDVDDGQLREVAEAYDPISGRCLQMSSTFPTVHLYTANFLTSKNEGWHGKQYDRHDAFCLEAQFAPNSPNIASFPSCILEAGKVFEHSICITFSTR